MARSYNLLVAVAVIVLGSISCRFFPSRVSATQISSSSANSSASTETPVAEILYKDDFSSISRGWISLRDEEGITDFDQGGYRIRVDREEFFFWANPGLTLSDVRIDVEATKIGGPDENEFGVICRYKDEFNFYFFTITSDGYYGITKVIDDEYVLIGMENLREASVINQGNTTNHMRVDCEGDTLRLYVNGNLLAEVLDDSIPSGDIGLIAGTYDDPGTDILFDNLVVVRP
jgi:hypothetical protein